jgi:hypothetical protein
MAFRKSVGRVCTALFMAPFLVIRIFCCMPIAGTKLELLKMTQNDEYRPRTE